jgi:hypothetical protein
MEKKNKNRLPLSRIWNTVQVWINVLVQSKKVHLIFRWVTPLIAMLELVSYFYKLSTSITDLYPVSRNWYTNWVSSSVHPLATVSSTWYHIHLNVPQWCIRFEVSIKPCRMDLILISETPCSSHSSSLITSRREQGSKGLSWLSLTYKWERKKKKFMALV